MSKYGHETLVQSGFWKTLRRFRLNSYFFCFGDDARGIPITFISLYFQSSSLIYILKVSPHLSASTPSPPYPLLVLMREERSNHACSNEAERILPRSNARRLLVSPGEREPEVSRGRATRAPPPPPRSRTSAKSFRCGGSRKRRRGGVVGAGVWANRRERHLVFNTATETLGRTRFRER